jgi:hypothetical protein
MKNNKEYREPNQSMISQFAQKKKTSSASSLFIIIDLYLVISIITTS